MATKLSRTTITLIAIAVVALVFSMVRAVLAVQEARHNKQALTDLTAVSQELGKDAKEKVGVEDSVDGAAAKAQQMQDALGKAAANMTGDGAKAIRANERLMGVMKATIANYESAYKGFVSKGGVEAKTLGSEAAIDERLHLLKTFESANQKFTELLRTADNAYREELRKENYPAAQMEDAVRGFREGGNFPTLLAIRATDAELCVAMAKFLTLLKTEWGKWKMNEDGAILFQNSSATEELKNNAAQLQDIADRQAALQEKVLNAQQKKASGKQSAVGGH